MNRPFVIWFTGISGAGKTTLSEKLYNHLKKDHRALVLLDGDDIRLAFGGDLGYEEENRFIQIQRIQHISNIIVRQGVSVIVAALYSHEELLLWNRKHFRNYFEIFLDMSISEALKRDTKNLYLPAQSGKISNVVGIDIDYRVPKSPDIVIDMNQAQTPDSSFKMITSKLEFSIK